MLPMDRMPTVANGPAMLLSDCCYFSRFALRVLRVILEGLGLPSPRWSFLFFGVVVFFGGICIGGQIAKAKGTAAGPTNQMRDRSLVHVMPRIDIDMCRLHLHYYLHPHMG
jgi:hypothetical protein